MPHAYVDSNVILRFLTGDPPDLAGRARSLFDTVERGELTLLVDEIVVAEIVWVLQSFYGYPPQAVGRTVQELLSHDGLQAEDKAGILAALSFYVEKNVDFADALVAVHMGRQGVREVFSFDKHFDRLPGVTRRVPGD